MFTELLPRNELHDHAVLLLRARNVGALLGDILTCHNIIVIAPKI
jgi:hypothetical protein